MYTQCSTTQPLKKKGGGGNSNICNNLEGIMLSEISQTKTNTVWYHLYVESKKENKLVNTKQKETQIQGTKL